MAPVSAPLPAVGCHAALHDPAERVAHDDDREESDDERAAAEPPFSFVSCSTVLPMPASQALLESTLYQSAPSAKNTTAATRTAQ